MATSLITLVKRFGRDDRGASLIEYAVLVALITTITITAITGIGGNVAAKFQALLTDLGGAPAAG